MNWFNRVLKFVSSYFKSKPVKLATPPPKEQLKQEELVKEKVEKKPEPISSDKNLIPPWLLVAEGEIGIKEVPGVGNNKRILEYHSVTGLAASQDSVPWCASFVSWCLEVSGIKSTKSARAKSYLEFGVKLTEPRKGCICVFNRNGGGHVGFYMGENDVSIFVLGGNQRNAVNIAPYSKADFLEYRWPRELMLIK